MERTKNQNFNKKNKSIYIVGIGGSATAGIAEYLLGQGYRVTGSDISSGPQIKRLKKLGIEVYPFHLGVNIKREKPDLVLFSPAVLSQNPNNPELLEAEKQKIPLKTWQGFLGSWFDRQNKKGVMVAGAGGKGSVASMLTYILIEGGLDPLAILGAAFIEWGRSYYIGKGSYFIMEADEFNYNFLNYHPENVVITSMVYDHPESYRNFKEYQKGFARFIYGMRNPQYLVLYYQNSLLNFAQKYVKKFPGEIITYGEAKKADYHVTNLELKGENLNFDAYYHGKLLGNFHVVPPCRFNALNALGALALSLKMGIPLEKVCSGLAKYQGLKQRFEIDKSVKDIVLIFDYAHAPRAIQASLSEARKIFSEKRLVAIFQPHMYSRTHKFLQDYSRSFFKADKVVLMDIFPSRELGTGKERLAHTNDLYKLMRTTYGDCEYIPNPLENVVSFITKIAERGDIFIILGAGSIKTIYKKVIKGLGGKFGYR